MNGLPFYQMYPAEAEADENYRSMNDAELGFYWRCLNHSWLNAGLPLDAEERSRVLHTPRKLADKHWERVGRCFDVNTDHSRFINPRQEKERSKALVKSQKATASIRARYENPTNVDETKPFRRPNVAIRASDSDSDSDSDLVSISEKEENSETREARETLQSSYREFLELWESPCECVICDEHTFPIRDADLGAQVWCGLVESGKITDETLPQVFDGLRLYRSSTDWHKNGGKFVMSVASFLGFSKNGTPNAPHWNDKPQQKGAYD